MKEKLEYKEVVKENGAIYRFPILTDEEREQRHQDFLRIADRILEKYKNHSDEKSESSL